MGFEAANLADEFLRPGALEASGGIREAKLAEVGLDSRADTRLHTPLEDNFMTEFLLELVVGKVVPPLGPLG